MGNGVERARPQATQQGAWRARDQLISKNEQEQTLLAEERPHVSKKKLRESKHFFFFRRC